MTPFVPPRHILTGKDITPDLMAAITPTVDTLLDVIPRSDLDAGFGHVENPAGMAQLREVFPGNPRSLLLFGSASTRTHGSFDTALDYLGFGRTQYLDAMNGTSIAKDETPEDTAAMYNYQGYRLAVVRLPLEDFVYSLAERAFFHVFNAGNMSAHHPTQAAIDLYLAAKRNGGSLDGVQIAIVGDLKYGRAPRSLIQALAAFPDVHLVLVAPEALQLDDDLVQYLDQMSTSYEMTDDLQDALHRVVIVYMTRLQLERVPDDQRLYVRQIYHRFCLNLAMLEGTSVHTVMHPLPRVDELSLDLDDDWRAAWNEQASYGVAVRMALILLLFGKLPLKLDL